MRCCCHARVWDTRANAKLAMSLPLQNAKKLLYAVWAPNGHDLLVTSVSNVNTIIDVRKEAVTTALPSDVEVCSTPKRSPCFPHACWSGSGPNQICTTAVSWLQYMHMTPTCLSATVLLANLLCMHDSGMPLLHCVNAQCMHAWVLDVSALKCGKVMLKASYTFGHVHKAADTAVYSAGLLLIRATMRSKCLLLVI